MPPTVGKGAISVAFVHPSVCPSVRPSVAYIANTSRTQRPSVPKCGRKVRCFWCDSHTSLKVKGQGHQAHYCWHTSCAKSSERQGLRISATAPWPARSEVKVARSRDQSEPSWSNAVPVSLEAGGGIPCRPNSAATRLGMNCELSSPSCVRLYLQCSKVFVLLILIVVLSVFICAPFHALCIFNNF